MVDGYCLHKTISLGTTNFPADRKKFSLLHNHVSHVKAHALNECGITPQSTACSPGAAVSRQGVPHCRGKRREPHVPVAMGLGHQLQMPPAISVDAWDAAGSASRGSEMEQERDHGRNTHEMPECMDSILLKTGFRARVMLHSFSCVLNYFIFFELGSRF